jgi:hypothetical protein
MDDGKFAGIFEPGIIIALFQIDYFQAKNQTFQAKVENLELKAENRSMKENAEQEAKYQVKPDFFLFS